MAEFSAFGATGVDMRNVDFHLIHDADIADAGPGDYESDYLYFEDTTSLREISYELRGFFNYSVDELTLDVDFTSSYVSIINASWIEPDEDLDFIEGSYEIRGFELDYTYFHGTMASDDVAEIIFQYSDRIDGTWNDDYLMGYGGRDALFGDGGDDTLDGGTGSDVMLGDSGDDVYFVDAWGDVVWEYDNDGLDTVKSSVSYELSNNVERLILTGTEEADATGNALANSLVGNSANNVLDGKSGADAMSGGAGNDTYFVDNIGDKVIELASSGTDSVYASVTYSVAGIHVEALTLTGSSHISATGNGLANTLTGNTGNNTLDTGAGNDKLIGGVGADKLYGGTGADTFLFLSYTQSTLAARDIIYDFSRAQADKIDLSAIDARTTVSGNQAFTFIGTAEFSNKAGELRAFVKTGETFIHGDLNGDSGIDFSIKLATTVNLTSADFIL